MSNINDDISKLKEELDDLRKSTTSAFTKLEDKILKLSESHKSGASDIDGVKKQDKSEKNISVTDDASDVMTYE